MYAMKGKQTRNQNNYVNQNYCLTCIIIIYAYIMSAEIFTRTRKIKT